MILSPKTVLSTKPSSRLDEASRLAQDLIGDVPATEEMLDAAVGLADTILLLEAIRTERHALLTKLPPSLEIDPFEEILIEKGFYEGAPRSAWYPKLKRALARAEAIPEDKLYQRSLGLTDMSPLPHSD